MSVEQGLHISVKAKWDLENYTRTYPAIKSFEQLLQCVSERWSVDQSKIKVYVKQGSNLIVINDWDGLVKRFKLGYINRAQPLFAGEEEENAIEDPFKNITVHGLSIAVKRNGIAMIYIFEINSFEELITNIVKKWYLLRSKIIIDHKRTLTSRTVRISDWNMIVEAFFLGFLHAVSPLVVSENDELPVGDRCEKCATVRVESLQCQHCFFMCPNFADARFAKAK